MRFLGLWRQIRAIAADVANRIREDPYVRSGVVRQCKHEPKRIGRSHGMGPSEHGDGNTFYPSLFWCRKCGAVKEYGKPWVHPEYRKRMVRR